MPDAATAPRYDGMLTDEILGRAMSELRAVEEDFATPSESQTAGWLAECEQRLSNALDDLAVVRDRFRKAQT